MGNILVKNPRPTPEVLSELLISSARALSQRFYLTRVHQSTTKRPAWFLCSSHPHRRTVPPGRSSSLQGRCATLFPAGLLEGAEKKTTGSGRMFLLLWALLHLPVFLGLQLPSSFPYLLPVAAAPCPCSSGKITFGRMAGTERTSGDSAARQDPRTRHHPAVLAHRASFIVHR